MSTTTCKSCGAEIIWAKTRMGKVMPLDAKPSPNGNMAYAAGETHAYTEADAKLHRDRYTSHFATCPDHQQWRQR